MRPVGLTRMAATALPMLDPLESLANEGMFHATGVQVAELLQVPAPPSLAAFAVEIATVKIVDYHDGEVFDNEPAYRLRPEVLVGDDLRFLYAAGQ